MKKLQVIILLIIAFILSNNWHVWVGYIKKDIKHAMHVQYCHDFYQGRFKTCPYYKSDILNK